jgi:hypothetical protein
MKYGRGPQYFRKWKRTSISLMKDEKNKNLFEFISNAISPNIVPIKKGITTANHSRFSGCS